MDYQSAALNLALKQAAYNSLSPVKMLVDELVSMLGTMQVNAAQDLRQAQDALGSSSAMTVGVKSSVTSRAELERTQGQSAAIDAIKANPQITVADACVAWRAGITLPTGRTLPLHDPAALIEEYAANAQVAGAIPDATWESFRSFIVATDKTVLMGM